MGYDLGAAKGTIEIGYDGKGVDQAKSALSSLAGASGSVASAIGGAFASATTAAVAFAGAIATIAISGGIARQLKIEDAEAKLRGLGHSADTVTGIMNDALASVKNTSYGLDEAATVAATAVAAGIEPGQELEKYLRLTANAATIAGTSMGEMGSIINKTTTAGKVYADNLNQLADRGIPIFQWLAEEYGVTADELRDMVSRGEVDSETFRKVIEKNIGGAALESGKTTSGAFKNMMAALSRTGAALTKGIFPYFKDFFKQINTGLDALNEAIGPTFLALGKIAGEGLLKVGAAIEKMLGSVDISGLAESFSKIGPLLAPIAGLMLGMMGPLLAQIPIIGTLFAGLTGPVGLAVGAIIGLLVAFTQLREAAMAVFGEIIGGIAAFVASFKAADGDITSAGFPGFMERLGGIAATLFSTIAGGITAFAAAFKAADGDITSGGFAGLMEQLGYAASQVMPLLKSAFEGVKDAVGGFVEGFGGIGPLMDTMSSILPLLLGPLGLVKTALMEVFAGGGDIDFAAFGSSVGSALRPLADAAVLVADALVGALAQAIPVVLSLIQQLLPVVIGLAASFGPLIAQLIGQLAPVIADLAQTLLPVFVSAIGLVAGIVVDLVSSFAPLIATLLSELVPVIADLIGTLLPALVEIFAMWASVVGRLEAAVVPLVVQLVTALVPIITQLVTAVLPLLVTAFGFIAGIITDVVIPALGLLVGLFTTIIVPVIQALLPVIITVFQGIADIITAAMTIIQGIITVVTGVIKGDWGMVWEGIKQILSGVWEAIKAIVSTAINLVRSVVSAALGVISALWSAAWNGIKSAASSIWEGIKSAITTAINAVKSVVSTIVNQIKTDMTNAWNAAKSATDSVWNGIKSAVSNAINAVVSTVRSLKGDILGAFSGAASWLVSAGGNIISGLVNGIKNMASRAVNAAKDVVGSAINAAKGALGISSPSKVFKKIGEQSVDGLVVGLDDSASNAAKAASRVAKAVASNGSSALAFEMSALANISSRMSGAGPLGAPSGSSTYRDESAAAVLDAAIRKMSGNASSTPFTPKDIADALVLVGFPEYVRQGVAQGMNERSRSLQTEFIGG